MKSLHKYALSEQLKAIECRFSFILSSVSSVSIRWSPNRSRKLFSAQFLVFKGFYQKKTTSERRIIRKQYHLFFCVDKSSNIELTTEWKLFVRSLTSNNEKFIIFWVFFLRTWERSNYANCIAYTFAASG